MAGPCRSIGAMETRHFLVPRYGRASETDFHGSIVALDDSSRHLQFGHSFFANLLALPMIGHDERYSSARRGTSIGGER
jgi:hypothetical protein